MKRFLSIVLAVTIILISTSCFAVGLKVNTPHNATCDPLDTQATGAYIYWRTVGGQFTDANRIDAGRLDQADYDLLNVIKVSGNYEIAASAYDGAGNESALSNIVPFTVKILKNPNANVR